MKGGGGNTTQVTESGMNKEFVPIYKEAMADALAGYKERKAEGVTATVADMTPEQRESLALQTAAARDQVAGIGEYDMGAANKAALRDTMGSMMGQASGAGALGSARTQKAMSSALASQSAEQQRARQADISSGISELGKAGTTGQKFAQQKIDAPYTEQTRLAGLLSGAPTTSTQTNTGGGGK